MIDKAKALELLAVAVKERGEDYEYDRGDEERGYLRCTYERDGKPSCLVGLALTHAGVTLDQLREMDAAEHPLFADLHSADLLPVEVADDAVSVFSVAQTSQDCGDTWGEALRFAREAAEDEE